MLRKKRNVIPHLKEWLRFVTTGVINTVIDFGVLNALLLALGSAGSRSGVYALCKVVSFSAALANSYVMNKHWVFARRTPSSVHGEKRNFILVSIAGFVINVAVSSAVFSALKASVILDHRLIANIGALMGTAAVLVWNYTGYKFFVFKTITRP